MGEQFAGRAVLRRTLGNSLWLLADHVFRLGVSLIVSIWVVRHLGPEGFGLLNFASAFGAPFAALLLSNLNATLVRDLVREPQNQAAILGTVAVLKVAGACGGLVIGLVFAFNAPTVDARALPLIAIVLACSVFSVGEVSDLWFQAQSNGRVPAIVRSGASLIASGVKVGLIFGDAPLVWFAATAALEVGLCSVGCTVAFARAYRAGARWTWNAQRARRLLGEGWPLLIAGIAMQIQAYFDQVLLAGMRDAEEVGYYAAGLRLVALLSFFPISVAAAAAPELTHAYQNDRALYLRRLRDVYRVLLGTFSIMAAPLVFMPETVVRWLFGAKFAASAALLPLLAGRLLLTNLGIARGLHLTNEGLFKHSLVTALAGMATNLALNWLLIPRFGAQGCAVAALVSFGTSTLLMEWLEPRTRESVLALASALGVGRLPK